MEKPPKPKSKKIKTVEDLIEPKESIASPTSSPTDPCDVKMKSGCKAEDLSVLINSTHSLTASIISIVSSGAISAGLSATKETLLYCAAALVRAADYFFIMSKMPVGDEMNIIEDIVKLSEAMAKVKGQGVPPEKGPSLEAWAQSTLKEPDKVYTFNIDSDIKKKKSDLN